MSVGERRKQGAYLQSRRHVGVAALVAGAVAADGCGVVHVLKGKHEQVASEIVSGPALGDRNTRAETHACGVLFGYLRCHVLAQDGHQGQGPGQGVLEAAAKGQEGLAFQFGQRAACVVGRDKQW
jgi:hypothetical protein